MLVDGTGQPLTGQVFRYDAFGNRLDNNIALTSLLYSGEQTDGTGFQYLRARYYDPSMGRFNRLDPWAGRMRDPQSLHKYLFTPDDPISFIDPSGREFTLTGMLSSSSIRGTIENVVGHLTTVLNVYNKVQRFKTLLEYGAQAATLVKSIDFSSPHAMVTSLMRAVAQKFTGATPNVGAQFLGALNAAMNAITAHWSDIAPAILRRADDIAVEVMAGTVMGGAAFMAKAWKAEAEGKLRFVVWMPSGPVNGSANETYIDIPKTNTTIAMRVGGGSLFGLGLQVENRKGAPNVDNNFIQQLFRIDYWNWDSTIPPKGLHVHYHIPFADPCSHPTYPGQAMFNRSIWHV